jgi:hypothetical protein
LALLGYNEGEGNVTALMKKYNTTDAWVIEHAETSKENYLAKVMSAIIIVRNPSLVD